MRIKEIQARLSLDDVNAFMATLLNTDQIKVIPSETVEKDVLCLQCDYRWGPITAPIDLTLTIKAIQPDSIDLVVESPGLSSAAVQELLRVFVKNIGVDAADARDATLTIDIDALARSMGWRFQLQHLTYGPDGFDIALQDVVLPADILKNSLNRSTV